MTLFDTIDLQDLEIAPDQLILITDIIPKGHDKYDLDFLYEKGLDYIMTDEDHIIVFKVQKKGPKKALKKDQKKLKKS
jgi:hypothetical protein